MGTVEVEPRRLRADAQRNRRRLIEAATELFSERGLEVGVADIAAHAGVGRGTLFRNFPSKEHLIAAIVVERMHEGALTLDEDRQILYSNRHLADLLGYPVGQLVGGTHCPPERT